MFKRYYSMILSRCYYKSSITLNNEMDFLDTIDSFYTARIIINENLNENISVVILETDSCMLYVEIQLQKDVYWVSREETEDIQGVC